MAASDIVIKGAREHNLQDVSLSLPRNQLICLTGVSGSGKSSLAFDTLYAEGQRRYVESLSSFARQFLGQMPKPDVDFIGGLSPSISIAQKSSGQNPRSTVGTITEIYDYLRVLFARVGQGHCYRCGRPVTAQSREEIIEQILQLPSGLKFQVLAPIIRGQKGEYRDLFDDLLKQGFVRARVDGNVVSLGDDLQLDRQMRHNIEVVVDRLTAGKTARARLSEAVDGALKMGDGNLILMAASPEDATGPLSSDLHLSAHYACTPCRLSFEPPSPQMFSFNSPQGMCLECDGLGSKYTFDPNLLVTDPNKSFQQGCFELIGKWRDMGRWRRHLFQGLADTLEYKQELPKGTLLETAWSDLPDNLRDILLWGAGDMHITYTWKTAGHDHKYGGQFDGVIPDLLSKYKQSKSGMQRRQLEKYMRVVRCTSCEGKRLNPQARHVTVETTHADFADRPKRTLPEICDLAISDAQNFFSNLQLSTTGAAIAAEAVKEIRGRLGFLAGVGLEYLTLSRTAPTLSGGESQRIRLAGQVGCGLVGVLYILDEPSIGLHPRDNDRLLETLARLRDLGNTVVVVEHDEDTMRAADHIIDFGPGPGVRGGEVVATGSLEDISKSRKSLTGKYLSGRETIAIPPDRRSPKPEKLTVIGASHNNLKNIDVDFPLGMFICVTGASGSGKSSLVNDIVAETLHRDLNNGHGEPGEHEKLLGLEHLDKLIAIDQSPIGRTPRSNPATYIKVLDEIRKLYTQLPEAKTRGYREGRFSFNVAGGRCEACEGNGSTKLEMDFLADVWVTCPVCQGHRFNRETLQIRFKGKSIADVLEMDVQQALEHFDNIPKVRAKLQTLHDVGLDYLKLGQPSPTLSGGEAQRVKLARELSKRSTGRTLYLLDEPTTGLHFADIHLLLKVLHDFVEAGNTVLVVEHNLDVIKTADWIIDLGPDGGAGGGRIVAQGTPETVAAVAESYTGRALQRHMEEHHSRLNGNGNGQASRTVRTSVPESKSIKVRGARQHNLKSVDVEIPRDQITVCCGPSGSGKSSLAMDTIYAEGQRRYVESLSAYARQFVGQMQKPKLEHIEGLSPAIAIEQKHLGHTPRSTVGTVTEIYDYLRVLMARLAQPYCPDCEIPIGTQSVDDIVDRLSALEDGTRLYLMAPLDVAVGEKYETRWEELKAAGYVRIRVDGETHTLEDPPKIDRRRKHLVEVIVDRVVIRAGQNSRLADSVEGALSLGSGVMHVAYVDPDRPEPQWKTSVHSQHLACDQCGRSFDPLTPHNFSFNSSLGWCPACEGLGTQTGANPAALLRDPKLTLLEGAVDLWPTGDQIVFRAMLEALSSHLGLPIDIPFDQLSSRHRRLVFHGCGEDWIPVHSPAAPGGPPIFRFQYKGLYPALEEASKLSPRLRTRLEHLVDEVECSHCGGGRLRDDAAAAQFREKTIDEINRSPLGDLLTEVSDWKLDAREKKIAGELLREIQNRLQFLVDVGLEYLTLARPAPTLSGGEAQRIRLASQVGSGLTGVLYVLDEPTIGLHPRDNRRLLGALHRLRDLGNTLLLVEHDREVVEGADQLLDFGPAAGKGGGEVVARGTPEQVSKRRKSVTGPYLSGKKAIAIPENRRLKSGPKALEYVNSLQVRGARHHNLRNITVTIPLGCLVVVTGPSGSGKSSLINDVLYRSLGKLLHRAHVFPGAHDSIAGIENVNKVIRVDQQPLGNTPNSNPATYTGVFELIRTLFAQLPESKVRGYTPRRFSFNAPGGRCERCEGNGQLRIEMHFLPDVWVECDTCGGKRYNPETLAVRYRGKSISDVLEMSCAEARSLFDNIPKIRHVLDTLCAVGLDYLTLGQPAPTLSGGEAQRVKLASELARPDTGQTLYLLDEPTTGLHFSDIAKLLDVLQRLVDLGNTVVVIEHNLDVIKTADWIVDMGPEAGAGGGNLVMSGTPEELVAYAEKALKAANSKRKKKSGEELLRSHTGEALIPVLEAGPYAKREQHASLAAPATKEGDLDITDVGRDTKMPWELNGERWHTVDRVGRNGEPCKWDGAIVAEVIDRIQQLGEFSPTNWNHRSVVEITGPKKSDGWFFHAITGEPWLVKLKFRVARGTFKRDTLVEQLALKPLNELPDLPVYGNDVRVQCKNLKGPWQEIQLAVHSFEEINHDAFWDFVKLAVEGFQKFVDRKEQKPEDVMPWKVLGEKWHLSRRGFPPGKPASWPLELLEQLCDLLRETAPEGQFAWHNQQIVHLHLPGRNIPWATLHTKRPTALELELHGPRNRFALGRVADLGTEQEVGVDTFGGDVVKVRFDATEQLDQNDLAEFLREHLDAVSTNGH